MFQKIKSVFLAGLPAIVIAAFLVAAIIYAWTEPSSAPPAGNVSAPLNVSTTTQYKGGALGVGGLLRGYSDAIFDGNVGVGTPIPSQKLEVNGSILATGTGDVCNGAGKCLSSVFQTNIAVGSDPVCPSGQTVIAKMNGGIWYSSAQSSWSQVMCGQVMSSDGTFLLVNNAHTSKNCVDAGGTVVSDGSNNMCRFGLTACPATWVQYLNWANWPGNYCSGPTVCYPGSCPCGPNTNYCTTLSGWINSTLPTCTYLITTYDSVCSPGIQTCSSPEKTQIGCY